MNKLTELLTKADSLLTQAKRHLDVRVNAGASQNVNAAHELILDAQDLTRPEADRIRPTK